MGKPRNRKQLDVHLNICSRLETQSCACVWEPNPRVQRLGHGNTGQAPATGNACQDTASGALAPLKHRRLAPSAPVSLISPGFQNSSALKPQGPRDTPPPHGTPLDLVSRKSTSWSPMFVAIPGGI